MTENWEERSNAIIKMQDETLERLADARKQEANAKVQLERARREMQREEEELTRVHQVKTYEIVNQVDWGAERVDPRTDELDQEWGQMIIDKKLREDEDFVYALGEYYSKQKAVDDAQEEVYEASTAVAIESEKLGSLKNRAMLLSSLMNLLSEQG